MEDLLRFGGVIFGVFLLLLAAPLGITRIYIYSLNKWRLKAEGEIEAIRSGLERMNRRVNTGAEAMDRVEELEYDVRWGLLRLGPPLFPKTRATHSSR